MNIEPALSKSIHDIVVENGLPGLAAVIIDSSGNRLFHKAFGVNDISSPRPVPYTTSTSTMIWSCTKLVSSVAACQLLEQGKISLDDPACKYVPELENIPVLDSSLDTAEKLGTRPAKSQILLRHLFTHTSGLCHDYFNPKILRWRKENGSPIASNFSANSRDVFRVPLLNDPGTEFHYGPSTEWLGFIIEAVTGMPIHKYITKNILEPLHMSSTTEIFDPETPRLLVHARGQSGKEPLQPVPNIKPMPDVSIRTAGAYLISTLDDYTELLLTILNKGTHPVTKARILRQDTVEQYLFQDQIPPGCDRRCVGEVESTMPHISRDGSLLPEGTRRGWSCGMMLNLEDLPQGRRKGSGMWAGIGNLYYWIDSTASRAGMVMTSVMPWLDPEVLKIFRHVEEAAYRDDEGHRHSSALKTTL